MDSLTAPDEASDICVPFYSVNDECELLPLGPTILGTWKLDDTLSKERRRLIESVQNIMSAAVVSVELCGYRAHEVSTAAMWRTFNISSTVHQDSRSQARQRRTRFRS